MSWILTCEAKVQTILKNVWASSVLRGQSVPPTETVVASLKPLPVIVKDTIPSRSKRKYGVTFELIFFLNV